MFIIPYTVPISTQIAWKLHQSIVRPRTKDFLDIILLLQENQLSKEEIEKIGTIYFNECKKDKIPSSRIEAYSNGYLSQFFRDSRLEDGKFKIDFKAMNKRFGFELTSRIYDISFTFKFEKEYADIIELLEEFEEVLVK